MLRAEDFRRIALGMTDAIEGAHMGHPDFRANGRIFASLHPEQRRGMVKLSPDEQARFVEEYPGAFVLESGAWGRQGYTRVTLEAVDLDTMGEAMTLAWQNVIKAAKKKAVKKRATKKVAAAGSNPRRKAR